MNVVELYTLAKWVNREVVESELSAKYDQLHAILHQKASNPSIAFEEFKNDLIETLKRVDLTTLTKDQMDFLSQIRILQAIGKQSEQQIENILFRHGLDITTAVEKFLAIVNDLNSGIAKLNSIFESLDGCIQDDIDEYGDNVLIRVRFQDNASMSNVKDFKEWGRRWHLIGLGIAIIHDATPEDIQIVGAAKGSVILELLTDYKIGLTVVSVILGSLEVTERVQNIRKSSAELVQISLENEMLTKNIADLETTAEAVRKDGVTNIINLQINELNLNTETDGTKINALKSSISNLVDFLERGGGVELMLPKHEEDPDSDEENPTVDKFEKIRESVTKIKKLEDKIEQIEYNIQYKNDRIDKQDAVETDENEPQE